MSNLHDRQKELLEAMLQMDPESLRSLEKELRSTLALASFTREDVERCRAAAQWLRMAYPEGNAYPNPDGMDSLADRIEKLLPPEDTPCPVCANVHTFAKSYCPSCGRSK